MPHFPITDMETNTLVIAALCSSLNIDATIKPLTSKEWRMLMQQLQFLQLTPADLLQYRTETFQETFQWNEKYIERIQRLLDRCNNLSSVIEELAEQGISLLTQLDPAYPVQLKQKLVNRCPPLFYIAGMSALLHQNAVGYVGKRYFAEEDIAFTQNMVQKMLQRGYYLGVSGGAKGIDSIAEQATLAQGGSMAVYTANSLLRRLENPDTRRLVEQGKLILLSAIDPDASFLSGAAMMRNEYIYAQSVRTIIIHADYQKGGTWGGAINCLQRRLCPLFCWNHKEYFGNQMLIQMGAYPIDETWDGDINSTIDWD